MNAQIQKTPALPLSFVKNQLTPIASPLVYSSWGMGSVVFSGDGIGSTPPDSVNRHPLFFISAERHFSILCSNFQLSCTSSRFASMRVMVVVPTPAQSDNSFFVISAMIILPILICIPVSKLMFLIIAQCTYSVYSECNWFTVNQLGVKMFASRGIVGSNNPTLITTEPDQEATAMTAKQDTTTPTTLSNQNDNAHTVVNAVSRLPKWQADLFRVIVGAVADNNKRLLKTCKECAPEKWHQQIDVMMEAIA